MSDGLATDLLELGEIGNGVLPEEGEMEKMRYLRLRLAASKRDPRCHQAFFLILYDRTIVFLISNLNLAGSKGSQDGPCAESFL